MGADQPSSMTPGEKRQMSVELIALDPQPVWSLQDVTKGQTEPGGWLGQCIGRLVYTRLA